MGHDVGLLKASRYAIADKDQNNLALLKNLVLLRYQAQFFKWESWFVPSLIVCFELGNDGAQGRN